MKIGHDTEETDRNVKACHHRNQNRGNFADDIPCKKHIQGQNSEHSTDDNGKSTQIQLVTVDLK